MSTSLPLRAGYPAARPTAAPPAVPEHRSPAGPRGPLRAVVEFVLAPIAVGLALARAAVRRPSVVAAAAILLVLVPSDNTDVAAAVHITPIDLGSAALVGAVGVGVLTGRHRLPRGARIAFCWILVALALATITSQDISSSLSGFIRYAQLFVLVPAAVVMAIRDKRDVALIAGAGLTVAVVEGAVGVYQYLTHTGASYGGADATSNIRAVGTFGALDIMGMATVVTYGLIGALALGLFSRGRVRVLGLSLAAALVVPLVLSLSRGSWIACVGGAAVVLALAGWRTAVRGLALTAAAAVLLIGTVGGAIGLDSGTVGSRFGSIFSVTSDPDQSVNDRYDLWQTAGSVWEDHPVTGVGLKEFPAYINTYAPMSLSFYSDVFDPSIGYQREPLLSPHNMYLLVLSEQGIIGIAAFGGLFVVVTVTAVRRARRSQQARAPAAVALGAALGGVMAGQLIDFLYADIGGSSTVLFAMILGVAMWWAFHDEPVDWSRPLRRPRPAGAPTGWTALSAASLAAPADIVAVGPVAPPRRPRPAQPTAPVTAPTEGEAERPRRGMLHAAALTAALNALGSVLGLGRDLLLAAFFGAGGGSDAFLVAWTVPETAAPLLIEDAMAFLMIPALSRARRQGPAAVRRVVATTLAPMALILAALSLLVAGTAPAIVHVLAPGLADPSLAVTCTRWASLTIMTIGLAGYFSAALRTHDVFGPPAAIYVGFNLGVIGLMAGMHARIGVVAAAIGLAVGGALMVAVQAPSFLRTVGVPRRLALRGSVVGVAAVLPIALYTITRQAQVFVERFLSSSLAPGTISHLNYAQKVAQVPMSLAVMLCTVTFPTLARRIAAGHAEAVRRALQRDLALVSALVLTATAYVIAFAPQIVALLFQHGAFTAHDTAATESIMRVYSLGLLGQALVGALCRAFYSRPTPTWYPAYAMAVGLGATVIAAAVGMRWWGALAIAGANAVGITVTAVLLLVSLRREVIDIATGALALTVLRLTAAAAAACGVGYLLERVLAGANPVAVLVAGVVPVVGVFTAAGLVLRCEEVAVVVAMVRRRLGRARAED